MSGPDERRVEVKVCGLTRLDDAALAGTAGADYVGAVLTAGFSRSVDAARARALGERSRVPLVGVLVDEAPAAAARMAEEAGVAALQLHGEEPPATLAALRGSGPWRLWKAVRPRGADDILRAADRYDGLADGLLVDGRHPDLPGGAGVRFPWAALEEVRERLPAGLRLIVAGGLGPANVAEAVERLTPHVVDVSSGVEVRTGEKDPGMVEAFVAAARRASGGAVARTDEAEEGA